MITKRACLDICPDVGELDQGITAAVQAKAVYAQEIVSRGMQASDWGELLEDPRFTSDVQQTMLQGHITKAETSVASAQQTFTAASSQEEDLRRRKNQLVEACQDGPLNPLCLFKRSNPGVRCSSPARTKS